MNSKNKIDTPIAIILTILFGVWGSLYVSKKGFGELFSINVFAHIFSLLNGLFLFFLSGVQNIYFIIIYSNILLIFLNLSWVLPIAKAKNNSEIELSSDEIISIGRRNIDRVIQFLKAIYEYNIIMFISLFVAFSTYAILTFFHFFSENFKIVCLVITFIGVFIFLVFDKAKSTNKPKIL